MRTDTDNATTDTIPPTDFFDTFKPAFFVAGAFFMATLGSLVGAAMAGEGIPNPDSCFPGVNSTLPASFSNATCLGDAKDQLHDRNGVGILTFAGGMSGVFEVAFASGLAFYLWSLKSHSHSVASGNTQSMIRIISALINAALAGTSAMFIPALFLLASQLSDCHIVNGEPKVYDHCKTGVIGSHLSTVNTTQVIVGSTITLLLMLIASGLLSDAAKLGKKAANNVVSLFKGEPPTQTGIHLPVASSSLASPLVP